MAKTDTSICVHCGKNPFQVPELTFDKAKWDAFLATLPETTFELKGEFIPFEPERKR